jgi:peptidoglycan/LPS O-acetylase OafA/YrhL
MLLMREFIPGFRNYPWMQFALVALALPFIFEATKQSVWDRRIGNLSYPVYLLHEPIADALARLNVVNGYAVLVATVVVSVAVVHWVEGPIDRWRQQRISLRRNAEYGHHVSALLFAGAHNPLARSQANRLAVR